MLAFFYALPAASSPARTHGRTPVAQYQLPAEAVARFVALATAASRAGTASESAAPADSPAWVGPMQQVGVGRNPYTLVLTVSGVAREASDVRAHWQAGWEVRESPAATREVLMSVAAQLRGSTTAGTPVTLTAISAPLSFRGERQAAPLLNFVSATNLDISAIELQVWSGAAPLAVWPALSAPRLAMLGLGALSLLMWSFLRHTARPPVTPQRIISRLPKADQHPLTERQECAFHRIEVPAVNPVAITPPPQNQASRVVMALRDVLLKGLAVPTELDRTRRPRRGRSGN